MNEFKQETVRSLFTLAGIPVLEMWELPNQYWPLAYEKERRVSPWFLVKTPWGLIKLGWRKRVMCIRWDDTRVRLVITADDVTKDETMVHAWTTLKAAEYLAALSGELRKLPQQVPITPHIERGLIEIITRYMQVTEPDAAPGFGPYPAVDAIAYVMSRMLGGAAVSLPGPWEELVRPRLAEEEQRV